MAKPAVQADNDAPDRAPAEDAVKALNFAKFLRAESEFDEAKGDRKETHKHVEAKGLNLKAAKIVAKILAKGSEQQTAFTALIRDVLELLEIAGTPVPKAQIDLFAGEEERTPADERARKAGRTAAFFGKGDEDNPHDPNSSTGREWRLGLTEGQAEVDLIMAMGADETIKGSHPADPFEDEASRVAAE